LLPFISFGESLTDLNRVDALKVHACNGGRIWPTYQCN